jgi:hypothetical protein
MISVDSAQSSMPNMADSTSRHTARIINESCIHYKDSPPSFLNDSRFIIYLRDLLRISFCRLT